MREDVSCRRDYHTRAAVSKNRSNIFMRAKGDIQARIYIGAA